MNIDYKTKKYGLIGNPIERSLSPFIHNGLYKKLDINNIYLTFEVGEDLSEVVSSLKTLGIEGYNVTIPYKKEIIKYLDDIDRDAENIGAVNTVVNRDDRLIGYNTDGIGFLKVIDDRSIDLKDKNILLLGSGGAANSIAMKLLDRDINSLYIYNRTMSMARNLKARLEKYHPSSKIELCNIKELEREKIDMIVNTSSVGMYPNINESPIDLEGFKNNLIIYDIVYKPLKTQLILDGISRGYNCINGIEMLVNQAIYSQEIWLDKKIDKEDRIYILNLLKKYIGED